MKTIVAVITFSVLLILLALPSLAQRPGAPLMRGRIVDVSSGGKKAKLALYYQAQSPDAPGEVPVEFARQIAKLKALAQQLQQQGHREKAEKMLQHIQRLECWREVEYSVTDWAGINLIGVRSKELSQIRAGMMVKLVVEVNGKERNLPERATLAKNVEQMDKDAEQSVRRLPGNRFLEIVGEVVDTKPLTIKVNGETIQVDTQDRYRFIERSELDPRELRAGYSVLANASLDRNGNVRSLRHLIVLFEAGEISIDDEI